MDIGRLVDGIQNVRKIIAVHEVTPAFGLTSMDSTTLAVVALNDSMEANYLIKSKGDKPRVSKKGAYGLLLHHLCGDSCYLDPKEFTRVVETGDGSLDYDLDAELPPDSRIYYMRRQPYQPSEGHYPVGY